MRIHFDRQSISSELQIFLIKLVCQFVYALVVISVFFIGTVSFKLETE